ncbi:unnamed protein product, partial [Cuscuta europaea]
MLDTQLLCAEADAIFEKYMGNMNAPAGSEKGSKETNDDEGNKVGVLESEVINKDGEPKQVSNEHVKGTDYIHPTEKEDCLEPVKSQIVVRFA